MLLLLGRFDGSLDPVFGGRSKQPLNKKTAPVGQGIPGQIAQICCWIAGLWWLFWWLFAFDFSAFGCDAMQGRCASYLL
jgi:hypothetical protein